MTYQLPEPNREFFCAKCGSHECQGDIREKHPHCAKCHYLGFAQDVGYTSAQMQAAYAAGVAAERELCAKLIEETELSGLPIAWQQFLAKMLYGYAAAIRKRCEDMSDLSALRGIQGVGL